MNTTTITTNSINKFNQLLNHLYQLSSNNSQLSFLPSPTTLSITIFTNSTYHTSSLLSKLTQLLNLKPLKPSYAIAA
jgi:hypothetical protein